MDILASGAQIPGGFQVMAAISLPIAFLISAGVLQATLPSQHFGAACLIKALQVAVVVFIAIGVMALVWTIAG
jgi:hypothetical protein